MGASGIDGSVEIPVSFTVEDDSAVKKSIAELQTAIKKAQDSLNKGVTNTKATKDSIAAMQNYVDTIEAARRKMLELKAASESSAQKAEAMKNWDYKADGFNKSDYNTAVSAANKEAIKARRDYITQSGALKKAMNDSYNAAMQEVSGLQLIESEAIKSKGSVDLFKRSLQDFQKQVEGVNKSKLGFDEITSSITRMQYAMTAMDNAVEKHYKTLNGQSVQVSPLATPELSNVRDELQEMCDQLAMALEVYVALRDNINDGSIYQNLKADGKSTEQFKNEIISLNEMIDQSIREIMEMTSVYEHEAMIAAQSAREMQGNLVTKSAPREDIGYAETSVQMTNEQIEAEKELAKAEEERIKREREAYAERQKAKKASIASTNKEIAAVKQSASQYYYKLRAVKMLGFTINQVTSTVDKFNKKLVSGATKALSAYLRLIPGVNALKKAFDKAHSSQKKFNKEMKNTKKSTNLATVSLGKFVLTTIKAVVGIRSMYMLLRKLRKAIGEGFESMAVQLDDVNAQLSSIVSSFNYMKAAITAVVQPILTALAPALERISALFSEITYKVSSFIAALTGQDFVYKAIRVETDYAESLDKTADSAKNAAKELGKYDKLNVISKDKDDDKTGGMQWEKVPLDETLKGWADKFKDFFDKLFDPLKEAWEKFRTFIINSWKYALRELLNLGKSIAKDFWKVWESDTVQKIFDNIAQTVAFIGIIVGNLAKNFRLAWEHNDNGYRILMSIAKCLESITRHILNAAKYTAKWSAELSFIPAMDALADNMEQKLVPAVERVASLFEMLYEQILLKIIKDFIEKGLPQLINFFGTIVETIGIIAEKVEIALRSGSNGIMIVQRIEDLLQILMTGFQDMADATKEWAENLDLRPLMVSLKENLEKIQPLVQFISDTVKTFWTDVLLPFWKYLLEEGFPKLLDAIGKIAQGADWETITTNMHNFMSALEPIFELAWEVLVQLISDFGTAIADFLGSEEFTNIINNIKEFADNFANMSDSEKQAYVEEMANKIEHFAGVLIGLAAAFHILSNVAMPFFTNYMTIRNFIKQGVMQAQVAKLSKDVAKLTGVGGSATGLAGLKAKLSGVVTEFKTLGMVLKNWGSVFTTPTELIGKLTTALGPKAGLLGVLTAVTGGLTALAGGFDMMNNGFSLGSEAITIFGGALTTVGLMIAGVTAWPAVIIGAITVLIANLGAFGDDILNWVWETGNSIREKIGTVFDNLGFYIGAAIHTILATIITGLAELPGKIANWITTVNWQEFGINILKGIFAIFLSVGQLISFIGTAIANLISGFIRGLCTGFDMHSPSKIMEPYGENILKGLLEGILNVIKSIGTWIKTNVFDPIMKVYKQYFTITALVNNGKQFIQGLQNSIKNGISNIVSMLPTSIQNIIRQFTNKLTSSTLFNVGRNLLAGLKEGISNGLSSLLGTVRNVCDTVINTFKDIFDINSPSGVTEMFGKNLMQGLDIGVEKESDEDMMPTEFIDPFISALTNMRLDAVDIVSSMVEDINDKMSELAFVESYNSQLNKIGSIKVPDIAIGSVLPSNIEFRQSDNKLDERTLNKVIMNAVADVLAELDTNSNKQPIMLQLDKRTVAEVVWDEEEKRYKQRGASYSPIFG